MIGLLFYELFSFEEQERNYVNGYICFDDQLKCSEKRLDSLFIAARNQDACLGNKSQGLDC